MPRFLFDLEARATGRAPHTFNRVLQASDAYDALTRAAAAMPSPHWGDAEITSLQVHIDLLGADAKP